MTATGIVDHSTRIEQSLSELNFRACKMGQQVQSLEKQITFLIDRLINELDKEMIQPKKFIPFYDREKFYRWNELYLDKFNRTLLKLSLETSQYERVIQNYYLTIQSLNERGETKDIS